MYKLILLAALALPLTGCEYIQPYIDKLTGTQPVPPGAHKAELTLYIDGTPVKYDCFVDPTTKTLINCTEVK